MKKPLCLAALSVVAVAVAFASAAGAQLSYPQDRMAQPQMQAPAPGAPPAGAQSQQSVSVNIRNFAFDPPNIVVAPGTTVTWTNNDSAPHTVTATDPAGAFDSGTLRPGQSFSVTFTQPGTTYAYYCAIHPSMRGTVTVTGGGGGAAEARAGGATARVGGGVAVARAGGTTARAGGAALAATGTYTDEVRGVEISAGQVVGKTRVGAAFVGRASGQLPGLLNASVNYTPPRPGPGVANTVVGGRWSLVGPWGALYGTFTGGEVRWNSAGTVASVRANMVILGGTVDGKAVAGGSGSFVGTLSHLTFPPTIEGTLTLTPSFRTAAAVSTAG